MSLKTRTAAILHAAGVRANFVTCLGLMIAAAAGIAAYEGFFLAAAVLLLVSGIFDLLDGAIARVAGASQRFGGILDSTLDRYGDGFVLGGILFFCVRHGHLLSAVLALSALLGSFAISYVRARAECVMDSCKVGFWERGERTVYLMLGLLFNNLGLVLWVMAVATHGTAFTRLFFARRMDRIPESASGTRAPNPPVQGESARRRPVYWVKCALLFAAVLWARIPLQ